MVLRWMDKYRDRGLLVLRIGLGAMFMIHGGMKLAGGPETWTKVGLAMSNFGIGALPTAWGLAAALSEFGGGLLVALGFFFRPACFFILCVMIVATRSLMVQPEASFNSCSHPIEDGIVFLSLLFIGPGKLALDSILSYGPPPEDDV